MKLFGYLQRTCQNGILLFYLFRRYLILPHIPNADLLYINQNPHGLLGFNVDPVDPYNLSSQNHSGWTDPSVFIENMALWSVNNSTFATASGGVFQSIEIESVNSSVINRTADVQSQWSLGEPVVFPFDSDVLNVKDFGAKGDGVTDDTAAIQAALDAFPNGRRIIYLPDGIYLVSDTLIWSAGTPGNEYKRTTLQGQSENGAVLKLRDGMDGFTDVNNPKAVIFTGLAPAQRFGNSIRNLTVDTGFNNHRHSI
jgi:Pectate lyase superfamily protein